MAYWDSKAGKIVDFAPRASSDYPGWLLIDCGCCGGLEWGGEGPRECGSCAGSGHIWQHFASGLLAQWPGGPCLGKTEPLTCL